MYWTGSTQPDSGEPEGDPRRVLRAAQSGIIESFATIGDRVKEGQTIAEINSETEKHKSQVVSPFDGFLRGMIQSGLRVTKGLKIGDVDLRNDPSACYLVSDKALAIGGGVLEATLSKAEIRGKLFAV